MIENIAGLILAQGGSRRMGQDKAELEYNGESFLNIAKAQLVAVGVNEIYINNAGNMADLFTDKGPLGGIYTALKSHAHVAHWLIVPIDMPMLTGKILTELSAALDDADMVRFEGEMFPLFIKSSDAILSKLTALVTDDGKSYSMRQFMQPFHVVCLPKRNDNEGEFINVNCPEDYEKLCG